MKWALVDAERFQERRDVVNAQGPHIVEAEEFGAFAEAQPIGRDDVKMLGQSGQGEFPGEFGAAAEFARMQQHHGKAAPAFEIMRAHAFDEDELAFDPAHARYCAAAAAASGWRISLSRG